MKKIAKNITSIIKVFVIFNILMSIFALPIHAQDEIIEEYSENQEIEEVLEEKEESFETIEEDEIEIDSEASQEQVEKAKKLEQELEEAKTALEKAEECKDSAQEKIAKGSIGFFESVGATSSVSILEDADYASYTIIGDEKDATSLKNMKDSIAFIEECNELRIQEGLPVLSISHDMMAIAQSDTNASRYTMGHTCQYYVSENLAWYYKDPFTGWYTTEKQVYDYKKAHPSATKAQIASALGLRSTSYVQTGHYLNIIDEDSEVTGFAISIDQYGRKTFGQVFEYYDSPMYSVSQYEAMFMEYYNSVYDAQEKYDQALERYNQALAAYNEERVYLVTFSASGANLSKKEMYVVNNEAYGSLPTPTMEGCRFVGWYNSYNQQVTEDTIVNTEEDFTLIAKFESYAYSVVYDGNEGYNVPSSQAKGYNQNITISTTIPEYYAHTFVEWNTKADGSGETYQPGDVYSLNDSLTLYAIWKLKDIDSITLDQNELYMFEGDEIQLNASILPWEMVEHTLVEWKSSNKKVATVENGKVVAKKTGNATITVVSHDGKSATCSVKVVKPTSRLEGYSLSISGEIGVNFFMRLEDSVIEDNGAYMRFTLPNGYQTEVKVSQAYQEDRYYVFPCYVGAKEMTSEIKAELVLSDGSVQCEYRYTVQEYATYLIEHPEEYNSRPVEIAKAMLTYGKYAQDYFGYNLTNMPKPINALEDYDNAWANYVYTEYVENSPISFVGARLLLTSKPTLKLYFLGEGTFRVENNEVSTSKEGKYTVLTISNIDNISEMFNISTDYFYLRYGIYSYCQQAKMSSNDSLKNMCKALVAYSNLLYYV